MPRFRYTLRTLLIVVTVICCVTGWLGIEIRKVRERQAVLMSLEDTEITNGSVVLTTNIGSYEPIRLHWTILVEDDRLPWHRKLLGDHFVSEATCYKGHDPQDVVRIKVAFPEATITQD